MFGDRDWPPNASRRFVSISWASCMSRHAVSYGRMSSAFASNIFHCCRRYDLDVSDMWSATYTFICRADLLSHVSMRIMLSAILLWQFRLSVRPSSAGIVYKRIHIPLNFFDSLVSASFKFFDPQLRYKIPRGTRWAGALNTRGREKIAIIALYLGNGTR